VSRVAAAWAGLGLIGVLLAPDAGRAHEERLMIGRVETIEPARRLLVVADTQKGERRRMEVNAETEVVGCRAVAGLSVVRPGGLVRVKYVDRVGAEPEAQSILVLEPAR
jgi:hypothetical protein